MFRLDGIDHIALQVRDVRESVAWYQDVLGLRRWHEEVWGDFPAIVGIGSTSIALFPANAQHLPVAGARGGGFRHVAFRASRREFASAQVDLAARGIAVDFQDHQLSHSIYLRDPDGYVVEITTYEL